MVVAKRSGRRKASAITVRGSTKCHSEKAIFSKKKGDRRISLLTQRGNGFRAIFTATSFTGEAIS
jgi:hypothetical protein